MNAISHFPLSRLERERKDSLVLELQAIAEEIGNDPDPRWSEAELLSVHLSSGKLKKFLLNQKAIADGTD